MEGKQRLPNANALTRRPPKKRCARTSERGGGGRQGGRGARMQGGREKIDIVPVRRVGGMTRSE